MKQSIKFKFENTSIILYQPEYSQLTVENNLNSFLMCKIKNKILENIMQQYTDYYRPKGGETGRYALYKWWIPLNIEEKEY